MSEHRAWLWPDHVAGKRETRRLREEYNALYNSHAELLEALQSIARGPTNGQIERGESAESIARAAIQKAGG